jgi:anti-sigma factor RsiW
MEQNSPVTEHELHAYVDGELPGDRRDAVEAWLRAHPEDAARVAAWRGQAEAIRARYGAITEEPVPERLRLARLNRPGRPWVAIAAAAALLAFVCGGAIGWMARGASAASPTGFELFTGEALQAHKLYVVEVRHPVEVAGDERPHLVQWLSKRLGFDLRIPDLEPINLKLVGGRLLPGPTGAAAFFMYEGRSGERFTFYCARSRESDTAMRYRDEGPAAAVYWVDRGVAYVMSGPGNRDELMRAAQTAYGELEKEASKRAERS